MKLGEIAISCAPWGIFIWTVAAWSEAFSESWAVSLVPLFIIATISLEYFRWQAWKPLGFDEINCKWFGCIEPNGKTLALILRVVALILIVIQLFIFIEDDEWDNITKNLLNNSTNTTLPDNFSKFTVYAKISSIVYSASGLVLLITLCQCGARLGSTKENILLKTEILRWGLHDLILGLIWTGLSFQFHDVVDDYDDSHWRHLFSSMIVFHIIILLFDIMSNPKYQIDWDDEKLALWSEATKHSIMMMIRFVMYSVIYYCILNRLHDSDDLLVNMGLDEISSYAIYTSSGILILINISEYSEDKKENDAKKTSPPKEKELTLRFRRRSLNF